MLWFLAMRVVVAIIRQAVRSFQSTYSANYAENTGLQREDKSLRSAFRARAMMALRGLAYLLLLPALGLAWVREAEVALWLRRAELRRRGVALTVVALAGGTAAHGIGAARALQVHPDAGAYADIALGMQAVLSSLRMPLLFRWWG